MPIKSAKQYGLMQAAMHGASDKVPAKVAEKFIEETPAPKRKQFAKKRGPGRRAKALAEMQPPVKGK